MNRAPTPPTPRHPEAGTMLLITMNVVVVLSAMAAAFLVVAHSDNNEHQSNDQRIRALYIAEAGVNLALGDLMAGGDGCLGTEATPLAFGHGSFSAHSVPVNNFLRIVSIGAYGDQQVAVEVVVEPEGDEGFYTAGAASRELTRILDTGSVDSYDSRIGSYESQRSGTTALDGDPVASSGGTVRSNGNVEVAPTATVNGSVAAPIVNAALLGSITGSTAALAGDQAFPPVALPELPGVEITNLYGSNDQLVGPGEYRYISIALSGTGTTVIQGPATIRVGFIHIKDDATLLIDATNGPVMIYPTLSMTIMDNGTVSTMSSFPKDLVIQSPVDNTTGHEESLTGNPWKPMKVQNQGELTGVLYAPDSTIVVGDSSQLFGTVFARRITVLGDGGLHFDESLRLVHGLPAGESKVATEWVANSPGGYGDSTGSRVLSWRLINPEGVLSLSDSAKIDATSDDLFGGTPRLDTLGLPDIPEFPTLELSLDSDR